MLTEQLKMRRTTLVLLPGLDGTEIFFAPLLRHLPAWIEPLIVAYPDSGANDYQTLHALVLKAVAPLESFVILGWSFGGPLALMVASSCAKQVSAVILCGSFVTPPKLGLVPYRFALSAPVVATVRALRRFKLLIPGYAEPEFFQAKLESWNRVNSDVLASRSIAALCVDVRPQLQACKARLMYLAASHDEVISRSHLEEVQSLAPATVVREVAGPHLALFTNPVHSAACIVSFMIEGQQKNQA